jgi:peptidoglycan/xylan/chitin deacetylase (PgdA/CDA1 family)
MSTELSINRLFGSVFFKGPSKSNAVALTFDDGPHPRFTVAILEELRRANIRATFFMTGENLRSHKNVAKLVHESGHEIANHSFSHTRNPFTGRNKISAEIKDTSALIEDITGVRVTLYRPPYGILTPTIYSVCNNLGLRIILWSINSRDYIMRKQSTVADRVIIKLKPGAIVLFHDCHFNDPLKDYSSTNTALGLIASFLARENLSALTVGSLIADTKR